MAQIYEAAIRVTGVNNFSAMFATLIGGIAGANVGVKKLEESLAALRPAALGAAAGILGFEGLKVVKDIAEHGEKLLDQQDKLRRAGIEQNEVLRMQKNFYDNIAGSIPTADAAAYLKTVNELRAVTGTVAGAEALTPKAMMVDTLLSNTFGKKMEGEYYKLLRSSEMKGIATDPKKLAEFTDQAFSYITAFGGKLTAQDFQTFARRGGAAWINLKPEAMGPVAVTMADLGGSQTGTALMTLQQLQQGTMTLSKQQAAVMQQAGLLDMSKVTKTGFGGGKLQLQPGAILGSLEYSGDLPGWIQNVVYPHMMKAVGGDRALFENMLGKEAPNRNAQKMIEMFGDEGFRNQIAKDLGLAAQVKPIPEAYQSFINTNPVGVKEAFNAQYESMMQAIGAPMMQAALPVMKGVTEFFTSVGAFANAHPGLMQALGIGFAGLSAAMLVIGGGAVIGAMATFAGTATLVAGGLTALGVSVGTAWLAFNHDWAGAAQGFIESYKRVWSVEGMGALFTQIGAQLKTSAENSMAALKEFASWFGIAFPAAMRADWELIKGAATSGFDALKSAFTGFFDWLKEKVNWLGRFIPGWKDMSGRASDIPGMSEHLHGGGGGVGGGGGSHVNFSLAGGGKYADEIRKYGGADAPALLALAKTEGGIGSRYDFAGDHGRARGPFQFNHGLLGDQLIREGINIDNPATFPAQVAWMRKYGRQHGGWDSNTWHGIKDSLHRRFIPASRDKVSAVPPARGQQQQAHTEVHLDGRIISHLVERRIVQKHRFASGPAHHDGRAGLPHVDGESSMG